MELVELPETTQSWSRRYRAVEIIGNSGDTKYWLASLEADGLVNQISIYSGPDPASKGFPIDPAWYGRIIFQGMALTEWFPTVARAPQC